MEMRFIISSMFFQVSLDMPTFITSSLYVLSFILTQGYCIVTNISKEMPYNYIYWASLGFIFQENRIWYGFEVGESSGVWV